MVSRIHKFSAELLIIGVNPFVFVPEKILRSIFKDAGKEKGFIRVKGKVNAHPYKQTLVKFRGEWRLYINTTMLKNSPKRIGEKIKVEIAFDPEDRSIKAHPQFENALKKNPQAKKTFDALSPSRRHEIVRYIASLKTDASVERNIKRAIGFLHGKERFVGREKP